MTLFTPQAAKTKKYFRKKEKGKGKRRGKRNKVIMVRETLMTSIVTPEAQRSYIRTSLISLMEYVTLWEKIPGSDKKLGDALEYLCRVCQSAQTFSQAYSKRL